MTKKYIVCKCGEKIELENRVINTCKKCGRDYNASGQKLASKCEWGTETGENLIDILSGI